MDAYFLMLVAATSSLAAMQVPTGNLCVSLPDRSAWPALLGCLFLQRNIDFPRPHYCTLTHLTNFRILPPNLENMLPIPIAPCQSLQNLKWLPSPSHPCPPLHPLHPSLLLMPFRLACSHPNPPPSPSQGSSGPRRILETVLAHGSPVFPEANHHPLLVERIEAALKT